MTFTIDLTDSEGKRRTVDVDSRVDLCRDVHATTLAAHYLWEQKGIEVNLIHSITRKP